MCCLFEFDPEIFKSNDLWCDVFWLFFFLFVYSLDISSYEQTGSTWDNF